MIYISLYLTPYALIGLIYFLISVHYLKHEKVMLFIAYLLLGICHLVLVLFGLSQQIHGIEYLATRLI